jgi:hypothetical protein
VKVIAAIAIEAAPAMDLKSVIWISLYVQASPSAGENSAFHQTSHKNERPRGKDVPE